MPVGILETYEEPIAVAQPVEQVDTSAQPKEDEHKIVDSAEQEAPPHEESIPENTEGDSEKGEQEMAEPEPERPPLPPNPTLLEVADHFGVELTARKIVELEHLRKTARERAQGAQLYRFSQFGRSLQLSFSGAPARSDFLPEGHETAPDDQATRDRIVIKFLRSTQNFMILVEAGLLERPGSFVGDTNKRQADFLTRHYGYTQTPTGESIEMRADYETVKKHAFSARTKAAEARIMERLKDDPRAQAELMTPQPPGSRDWF
jgi:hypothetical protein